LRDHLNSCHPERGTDEAPQARPHRPGGTRSLLARRGVISAAAVATTAAVTLSGIAVSGIAVSAQASTHGATAVSAAVPAVAAGPGHWVEVTAKGTSPVADVGLARGADGVLHVLWAGGQKIMDTPIAPHGTPGKSVAVASGMSMESSPDATVTPSGIYALWNGVKTGGANAPKGTFWATRPLKGGQWKLGGNVPPVLTAPAANETSVTATTGGDGKPWMAYTYTDSLVVLHLGQQGTKIAPTQCCVYETGLATDGKTGATWLAYYAYVSVKTVGYYLQKLSKNAASGNAVKLPGPGQGGGTVTPVQRVALTGRGKGHGGVYALYGDGHYSYTSLNLIATGSTKPVSLATTVSEELQGDTITAGPDGRLWATWWVGGPLPDAIYVRATKTATGTAFGKTITVPLPAGRVGIWKVYTSAQAGRLDVVALLTRGSVTAYYATQVLLPK
jgi:hypothetical protein